MSTPIRRVALALVAAGVLGALAAGPVLAVDGSAGYRGPSYAGRHETISVSTPTFARGQSKVWWHDGAWWGLLYDPDDASAYVAELTRDHRWRRTGTVVATRPLSMGDAVPDGRDLHVLLRVRSGLQVTTLRYRPKAHEYRIGAGPVDVGTRGSGSASMALDSTGRLWVSFLRSNRLTVMHSNPSRTRWSLPLVPKVPGTHAGPSEEADVAAVDGAVTLVWSNQRTDGIYSATHQDGAVDSAWTGVAITEGEKIADDHVSAHVAPGPGGSTLLVAVKTSRNDFASPNADDPLVLLLARGPDGRWRRHQVATVGDGWTRPVVTSDASGRVYVFARRAGSIQFKQGTLAGLSFEPGTGGRLLASTGATFTDPSVGQQVADSHTGVLLLTSDEHEKRYWHAEMAIDGSAQAASAADPPDTVAPARPGELRGSAGEGRILLSWNGSADPDAWAPAGRPVPVRYVVRRDGRALTHTTATSFSVRVSDGSTHDFSVAAVDRSGNESPTATVSLAGEPPGSGEGPRAVLLAGGTVLALVAFGVALHLHLRRQLSRTAKRAHRVLMVAPRSIIVPAPKGRHTRR